MPETPYFLLSERRLREKVNEFRNVFPGELLYSVKTNPDREVLEVLRKENVGWMACSIEEVNLLKGEGISLEECVYHSPGMDGAELSALLSLGVRRFVADSEAQVNEIVKAKGVVEIGVRVHTGEHFTERFQYPINSGLGVDVEDVSNILGLLAEFNGRVGIHNHLSSQNDDLKVWRKNGAILADLVERMKDEGRRIDFVNFGGGFPVRQKKEVPDLWAILEAMGGVRERMLKAYPDVSFLYEPGRVIVGGGVSLHLCVRQVKIVGQERVIILDGSVYSGLLDIILVGQEVRISVVGKEDEKKEMAVVRGSSPCSCDVFGRMAMPEVDIGDEVVVEAVGAYPIASDFLGYRRPELHKG